MSALLQTPGSVPKATPPPLRWLNRFHALGPAYFTELAPQGLPAAHWVARSDALARELGWPADWAAGGTGALEAFSGNGPWPGMHPLASVYSGHQFGVWAGQLGDGRAHWLGEIDTPARPMELQLKGAGLTPYSRMGDGRAVLRSSIREFLCSEAMHGLGIPTTRALCITGSALPVRRETVETAAVVTRVAPSFIRFGHFQHFAANDQIDNLRRLADFVIDAHFPACREAANPAAALLREVTLRTATLMAHWQGVGFCHGVMNTDNMSILGLTIDYGPFGFLDGYEPGHVCNHSDDRGRYAFARQPQVALWNLHALAQALLPLIGESDEAVAALEPYKAAFDEAMAGHLRRKLGLAHGEADDAELAEAWLALLTADRVDHTIAWRRLCAFETTGHAANASVRDLFIDRAAFDHWALAYRQRLQAEGSVDAERARAMNRVNPKFVLRNHLADVAIQQAQRGDFSEVQRLLAVLERPFDEQPDAAADADFPPAWAQTIEVSCSS